MKTDLSRHLREVAQQNRNTPMSPADVGTLLNMAANEIDRYYTGMANWKATAEAKDRAPVERQAPEGLRQAVYMALHYYMNVQNPNEWEATDKAIEAMQSYCAAPSAPGSNDGN